MSACGAENLRMGTVLVVEVDFIASLSHMNLVRGDGVVWFLSAGSYEACLISRGTLLLKSDLKHSCACTPSGAV